MGKRERKVRNGGGGRILPPAGGGVRTRSRPGTAGLAKQLSAALDDWDMGGEAGESTSDRFKRIDDKMTQLDDYKRVATQAHCRSGCSRCEEEIQKSKNLCSGRRDSF